MCVRASVYVYVCARRQRFNGGWDGRITEKRGLQSRGSILQSRIRQRRALSVAIAFYRKL